MRPPSVSQPRSFAAVFRPAGRQDTEVRLADCDVRIARVGARHVVLVNPALAACAITAALLKDRTGTQALPPVRPDQPPSAEPGMIPR